MYSRIGDSVDNPTFRFDSQYFKNEFTGMQVFERVIGQFCLVRSGTTPSDRDDSLSEGVNLLKTTDVRNLPLSSEDEGGFYKITESINSRMQSTELKGGDVLINIVGATTDVVGRVALVPSNLGKTNITQAMAFIRVLDGSISPELLFIFLQGKYGNQQVCRLARPTGQYNLNIPEVCQLRIPSFSAEFNAEVKNLVQLFGEARHTFLAKQQEAKDILLKELGVDTWNTPQPLAYTSNSKYVFSSGRLDPEYFQPKYSDLSELLDATGSVANLGDLLLINQRGTQPKYSDTGLSVINSKHVLVGSVRLDNDNRVATVEENRILIQKGDVLINGTGVGTIGRSAPYLYDTNAIPDNHVTILRPKSDLDPVYLSVFLNSVAGQLQVEKWYRGSSGQIELYPADLKRFKIWIAPSEIQMRIRKAIHDGFMAKQQSTQLLDVVKKAVELAVERGEKVAKEYLKEYR